MIRRTLASVFLTALLCAAAMGIVRAGELSNFSVSPDKGTANSVYTYKVTWTDSNDAYPVSAAPKSAVVEKMAVTQKLEETRPVRKYGGEGDDDNGKTYTVVNGDLPGGAGPDPDVVEIKMPANRVPVRWVIGVWKATADHAADLPTEARPMGNQATNLVDWTNPILSSALPPAAPLNDIILLDKTKCDGQNVKVPADATKGETDQVWVVFYAQPTGATLNRVRVKLEPLSDNDVAGVFDNNNGNPPNYYQPADPATGGHVEVNQAGAHVARLDPLSQRTYYDIMLGTNFPSTNKDAYAYVTYEGIDPTRVRFKSIWNVLGVVKVHDADPLQPQDDWMEHADGWTFEAPYWYIVTLTDTAQTKPWPKQGLLADYVVAGNPVAEPVECVRPDKPTARDRYRTGKIAWLGRSHWYDETNVGNVSDPKVGPYVYQRGQVPIEPGGLLGIFDTPNPVDPLGKTANPDPNYLGSYNRHTGEVRLQDFDDTHKVELGKIYWALYEKGPITLWLDGRIVFMSQVPGAGTPRYGTDYYVRVSAGENLMNNADGIPGVNWCRALSANYPSPPNAPHNAHIGAWNYDGQSSVEWKELTLNNQPIIADSTPNVRPGYRTEHDLADPAGTLIEVPFKNAGLYRIDGVYALDVDWANNGRVIVDWKTNYYTGGSLEYDTSDPTNQKTLVHLGSACVRTEKIQIRPYSANGLTQIDLPRGYAEVIKDAGSFLGVYLNKGDGNNLFTGGTYTPGDQFGPADANPSITLGTALPADTQYVWIQYIPRVMMKAIWQEQRQLFAKHGTPKDETDYTFDDFSVVNNRYGGSSMPSTAVRMSSLDPLNVELQTTTAGRMPVADPANPGQTTILRANAMDPTNWIGTPDDQNHPDDGTSSSAFVFRCRYLNGANLGPHNLWLVPGSALPGARSVFTSLDTGGVILYLDYKGYGDYHPYFMVKQDPKDYTYDDSPVGCVYTYRVEPTEFLGGTAYGVGLPQGFPTDNLYRSLLIGQYHYYFAASADFLPGNNLGMWADPGFNYSGENPRVWLDSDLEMQPLTYDAWAEPRPYDPTVRMGQPVQKEGKTVEVWFNDANNYATVDRTALSPGDVNDYPWKASEHPVVHPQLEPPYDIAFGDTASALLPGNGLFLGTLIPYYRSVNPGFNAPSLGQTFGHAFGGTGDGIETSGSTTSTKHKFRIKYSSQDPITGTGISPTGGVWVYINNASDAGHAGSSKDPLHANTSDTHYYKGYRMQPVPGDPLDYVKGVVYEATDLTLPAGPHTYYFEANDGFGDARYPVRPDGRWQDGFLNDVATATGAMWTDPWVPGDQDYADNNDYCPGPYVNSKPRITDASVTPSSGPQGNDFIYSVKYWDDDGPKGQRPYKAELIIEIDQNTHETRRVSLTKRDPSNSDYKNGVEYVFNTNSAADLALAPGEHRYYFEFVDDWGHQGDPNDIVAGEKVRYPQADGSWVIGPVVMAASAPTLSDGTVESTDGTANSATLWKFGVTYADANNEAPVYVNLYTGEEGVAKSYLERTSPVKDSAGNFTSIVMSHPQVTQVAGVFTNPEGTGSNLMSTNGGSIDTRGSGIINFATPLPDGSDVYVTYYHADLAWDAGHEMTKANASDSVYSDGTRYETNLRLGGSTKGLLDLRDVSIQNDANGKPTIIKVDPNLVRSVIGIYDNQQMQGFDYWAGTVVNEQLPVQNYDPSTGTARVVVNHAPISSVLKNAVYGNPRGTGTNYLASIDADDGIISLKGIPLATGSQTQPAVAQVFVSYSTPAATYDPATGIVQLGTPLTTSTPFIFYTRPVRAYHFAFEASDGQMKAVYNTAIDTVTLQDSRWAGAIFDKSYQLKEDLSVLVPGRQYAPKFMGSKTQLVEPGQVLIAGVPQPEDGAKDMLLDPALYKNDLPLVQQYEDVAKLTSDNNPSVQVVDPTGYNIQLQLLTIANERAWRIDGTHVQLRMGPVPDQTEAGFNPVLSVLDVSDGLTRFYGRPDQTDGPVDADTGVLTLTTDANPVHPVPDTEPTVLATYNIWGVIDPTYMKVHGVSDVLAIYDNSDLSGFDYWSGCADREPHQIERLAGSEVRIKVDHTTIRRIIGVWGDPTNTSGTGYLDHYDANTGLVWLKNVPATLSQVYVTYYTDPGSYDRHIGKITLGSPILDGKRVVWIKYREHADYRTNTLGDAATTVPPTFIFNYDMPSTDPATGANAWAGTVKADYWFARKIPQTLGYNNPPKLTNGKLTPLTGTSAMDYVFTVDYTENDGPNGQAPSFVRVIIDGTAYDMTPVVAGTPAYNAGATYRYTTKLPTGAHKYHFEASDGEGFAFFGYFGSTPTNIVDIPGPWVNDPPTLTNAVILPAPTTTPASTLDSTDFKVTYTDADNDAPDAGNPWCWLDYGKTVRSTEVVKVHNAVVDQIILENGNYIDASGNVKDPNGNVVGSKDTDFTRARRIRFVQANHTSDTDLAVASEAQTPWYVDQFAGKYLQITDGVTKGRVYQIAYNNDDSITVLGADIRADKVAVGDKFMIGPVSMGKEDASQMDYTKGIVYKVTIPRMAATTTGHTYHFETTSTAWIPKTIGDAFTPPLTDAQRMIQRSARLPGTGELQGPKVTAPIPVGDRAPELYIVTGVPPVTSPNPPRAGGAYTFTIGYRDPDGDMPVWRADAPVLGYIRVVFDDGSFAEDLLPTNTGSADFIKGVTYAVTSTKVVTGTHTFHFEASDGWRNYVLTDPSFIVRVNNRPQIIVGDDRVTPPTGNQMTAFRYTATIKDADGTTAAMQVKLLVSDPANPSNTIDVPLTKTGTDYAAGVVYSGTVTPNNYPSVFSHTDRSYTYQYIWTATDGIDAAVPYQDQGPTVNPNLNAPTLRFPLGSDGTPAPVDPMRGNTTQSYQFQVVYSDKDGDAPVTTSGGVAVEGIALVIDTNKTVVLRPARATGSQPDYIGGEKYTALVRGRDLPDLTPGSKSGTHNLLFMASDGLNNVQLAGTGPTIEQSSITLTPDKDSYSIGGAATINGTVTPAPSTTSTISINVKKPDGSGWTETRQIDTQGRFSITFPAVAMPDKASTRNPKVLDMTKTWTISARWDGTPATGPASQEVRFDVSCNPFVLAADGAGNPLKDMVSSPLIPVGGGDLLTIWGVDKTMQMDIARYDPDSATWITRGVGYLPAFTGGEAYRIVPRSAFPKEGNDPYTGLPTQYTGKMTLMPYGKLWYQSDPFIINVRTGWNQIGTVYTTPINFADCLIRYQGADKSVHDASVAGTVKEYAWTWDATAQEYRLVSAERADALKTLDPYRGYWFYSNVDCQIILQPATSKATQSVTTKAAGAAVGADGYDNLAMPPAP